MAKIKMIRIDYRMVHGQIVAKWIKFRPVDRLILANDSLVNDPFMGDIYRMAVPQKDVDIVKLKDIQDALNRKDDTVMLIFKDVDSAYKVFKDGLKLPELNVGAVQNSAERKSVIQGVSLSADGNSQPNFLCFYINDNKTYLNSMGTTSQSILSNLGIDGNQKISVYDPFMNFTDDELTSFMQSSSKFLKHALLNKNH